MGRVDSGSLFGLLGPPNVKKLKAKGDVQGLITALGYKRDATVPQTAAQALVEIGHAREAVEALEKMDDARAVAPLIIVLRDKVWRVRRVAARALEKIGTLAVEPLIAALKDEEWRVREGAASALGQIGDPRGVAPLIAALEDTDRIVRRAAASALGQIGDPRGAEPLTVATKDGDRAVRRVAARALGQIGDPRGGEPLVAALKDADMAVRRTAAKALDKLGWQPEGSETNVAYWIAKRWWDRCAEIGAPAVEPLIAALKDEAWQVREGAARALGQIGDPRGVEPLVVALTDKKEYVRHAAVKALDNLGWQPDTGPLPSILRSAQGR
jgi:HEAT repeat protein